MLSWIIENTVVVLVLAAVGALAARGLRARPGVCHLLWVALLVRLVAPPIAIGALPDLGLLAAARSTHGSASSIEAREPARSARPVDPPAFEAKQASEPVTDLAAVERETANAERKPARELDALTPTGLELGTPSSGGGIGAVTILLGVWGLGSALVAARQVLSALRFRALLRTGARPSEELVVMVASVAQRLGIAPPRIRVVAGMGSPLVWSLGRPLLAWPAASRGEQELAPSAPIVAHELAHLRRRDHWVAWLEVAALCLCWWNPVYWLVQRRVREQAELACDAWVVTLYPEHRRSYAVSLIDAAERRSARPLVAPALGATDTTVQIFRRRLEMILRDRVSCRVPPLAGALALLCTVLALPSRSTARQPASEGAHAPIGADLQPLVETALLRSRAQRAFEAGAWKQAADAYRTLAEREASNGAARHQLGYSLLAARDPAGYAEAALAFEEQARLGHRLETAEYNAACARALLGEVETALEHLHRAVHAGFLETELLRNDPDLAALRADPRFEEYAAEVAAHVELKEQAGAALRKKDWGAAAAAYEQLVDALPMHGEARAELGKALAELGQHERAAECFAAQARLGQDPAQALFLLARSRARTGDAQGALTDLERAVDAGYSDYKLLNVDPALDGLRKDERFHELLESVWRLELAGREAYAAQAASDWETAAARYRSVLANRPKDGALCAKLGRVLFRQGAYAEAIDAFVRQAQSGHDLVSALYDIACAYAQQGRREDAIAHAQSAVELGFADAERMRRDPDLASLRNEAGFQAAVREAADNAFLREAGAADWEELAEHCLDAIDADPRNGKAHHRLGWAYLRLAEYERAAEAFAAQDEIGHAPAIARYNAACARALQGEADLAFAWLERAAEIGFADAELLQSDLDLAALREDPRFGRLIARLRGDSSGPSIEARGEAQGAAWKPSSEAEH